MKSKLIILLFFISFFLSGSNTDPVFQKYGLKEGFSDISFRNIMQDKKGFLWFATINGLNRYDGKNVKVFVNEHDNPYSLSYNRIYSIYEDYYGYIWIVTYDSEIHRLDPKTDRIINVNKILKDKYGKQFSTFGYYESSPGLIWIYSRSDGIIRITEKNREEVDLNIDFFDKSKILPSNTIRFIHKDKKGNLWIGTMNGLTKFNTDSVLNTSSAYQTFLIQDSADLTAYCENDKNMLFGTMQHGLFEYSFENQYFNPSDKFSISTPIWGIVNGINKDVLISTQGEGLFYIMNEGCKYIHLKPGEKRGDIVEKHYELIYNDRYGKYWIRRPKRGITFFDPQSLKIKTYLLHPEIRESAGEKDAPRLLEDSNNDLWISLYGGGLCKLNRENMTFNQYFYKADNPASLSSNFILSIFEDNSANLWLGTYQGGLNKVEIKRYPFDYIQPIENPFFQSLNEVRAVMTDKFNRTWIGTKEGHIFCYDTRGNKVFTFPDDIGLSDDYIQSNVYDLYEDNKGNLWIGTKGYGLYIIEDILSSENFRKKYNIINYHHIKVIKSPIENYEYDGQDNNTGCLSHNDVYTIHQDNYGQMWIGTYAGGINLVENVNDISFKWLKYNPIDSNSISDNKIRYIFQDSKKNLWVCTANGLVLLKEKYLKAEKKMFIRIIGSQVKNTSQTNNDIICCFEDSKNHIWTGTYGDGLNHLIYDTCTSKYFFENFNIKNGLPSAIIHSIEEDKYGNLWLGTDNGLCKFNYETKQIENYFKEEGLGDNLFSEGASDCDFQGRLIFGHKNGFISFYPDSIEKDTFSYNVFLTGLKINGKFIKPADDDSPLSRTIESEKKIVLEHDQNFLEIQFAILDYMKPERCQYRYKLEGIDNKWILSGNKQLATYTSLDPGYYKFRVQASNHDGYWSKHEAFLKIKIKPPYYKTWLFRILIIIVFLALVYALYLFRISNLTKRQIMLEKLVKERTSEVEEKNKILLEQTEELNQINKVLEERQNYIEKQSTELTIKNEDLEKSNATKDKLFTIIAHDLKNPFNTILGFFNVILTKYDSLDDNKIKSFIEITHKSAKNVFTLLENLLQWSGSQMGLIKFSAEDINLLNLINHNISLFENMLNLKEIVLTLDIDDQLKVYADINMLNTIIRNIVSNSIKFTEKGIITIRARKNNGFVTIEVEDTGTGIKKEKLDQLFTIEKSKSARGTQGEGGSGLGLLISKEFVERNKGTIYVKSEFGKGSVFGFTIPASK